MIFFISCLFYNLFLNKKEINLGIMNFLNQSMLHFMHHVTRVLISHDDPKGFIHVPMALIDTKKNEVKSITM
jgi:hypothetical protein